MPPKQCPMCGRFLKNILVTRLAEGEQPCPGCGDALTADMFGGADGPLSATGTPADAAPVGGATSDEAKASVRPPDLPPDEVRDDASDVLDGWDRGASAAEMAGWAQDRSPFPTDAVVVAATGFGGMLVGGLLLRDRLRGVVLGGLLGVVVAAVVRQVWRLPD